MDSPKGVTESLIGGQGNQPRVTLIQETDAEFTVLTTNSLTKVDFAITKTELLCLTDERHTVKFSTMIGCKKVPEQGLLQFIFYVKQSASCTEAAKLTRKVLQLKVSGATSQDVVNRWHAAVHWILRGKEIPSSILEYMPGSEPPLPEVPRLLVFVNPVSGSGRSEKIWSGTVSKILIDDAELQVEKMTTQYMNHAKGHISTCEDLLDKYDGIVVLGGDGLYYEVVQGVMSRKDWASVVQRLPIGIIPGGSGNGLGSTFANAANLPTSPTSCAFIVAKQESQAMDLCAVDVISSTGVKREYSFLGVTYGANSYLDLASDGARYLGTLRFTLWGVLSVLRMVKYKWKVSYMPVEGSENAISTVGLPQTANYWDKYSEDDHKERDGPITELLPDPSGAVPSNWTVQEGEYSSMINFNVRHMSEAAVPFPDLASGNGYLQMVLVPYGGRLRLFDFLTELESGTGVLDKKYAILAPMRAYRFEPLDAGKPYRYISLDGESAEYTALQVENLRGFFRVMCLTKPYSSL